VTAVSPKQWRDPRPRGTRKEPPAPALRALARGRKEASQVRLPALPQAFPSSTLAGGSATRVLLAAGSSKRF
jgi:hypothetical protein